MAGVDHDTLAGWLTRLQLTAIRDQLDNLLDEAAQRKLTLRESLAMLVGCWSSSSPGCTGGTRRW